MDPILSHALTALVMSLVAGIPVYVVSYLTTEGTLFTYPRQVIRETAEHDPESLVALLQDLVTCAFCSSWWHAMWLVPLIVCNLGGGRGLAVAVYFGAVGIAKLINDLKPKPVVKLVRTLQEMARDAA